MTPKKDNREEKRGELKARKRVNSTNMKRVHEKMLLSCSLLSTSELEGTEHLSKKYFAPSLPPGKGPVKSKDTGYIIG